MKINFKRRSNRLKLLFSPSSLTKAVEVVANKNAVFVQWPNGGPVKNNWGDKLNPYIVEKVSDKKVYSPNDVLNVLRKPVYKVIGSGLGSRLDKNVVVWGSGFISYSKKPMASPLKICSVRGPLSRKKYLDSGITCPEIFGDPAILCPRYYNPNIQKKHKLGFIPHWKDVGMSLVAKVKEIEGDEVKVIDICGGIESFVDDILSCENIISSSLHGLIASDSYGVPSLWIRLSDNPMGDFFKFHDYYESIGIKNMEPATANSLPEFQRLFNKCVPHEVNIDEELLLEACPFRK